MTLTVGGIDCSFFSISRERWPESRYTEQASFAVSQCRVAVELDTSRIPLRCCGRLA